EVLDGRRVQVPAVEATEYEEGDGALIHVALRGPCKLVGSDLPDGIVIEVAERNGLRRRGRVGHVVVDPVLVALQAVGLAFADGRLPQRAVIAGAEGELLDRGERRVVEH